MHVEIVFITIQNKKLIKGVCDDITSTSGSSADYCEKRSHNRVTSSHLA